METKINGMQLQDLAFMGVLLISFWFVLVYILGEINTLMLDSGIIITIYASAIALGGFATLGTWAVIKHTIENRQQIYTEDIDCLNKIEAEKLAA